MNNFWNSIVILFPLFLFTIAGCKESTQEVKAPEKPAQITPPVTNDAKAETPQTQPHELPELQKDVESRLEALVSLIEQRENSLLGREQSLLEREQSLVAQSAELARREQSVRQWQIISWVVLAVGLAGIIVGLVISRKPRTVASRGGEEVERNPAKSQETNNEMKDAYLEKMEFQLQQWEAAIAELKSKGAESPEEVRADYKKQVAVLKRKLTLARKKLQELRDTRGEAWQERREGIQKTWREMDKSVDKATEKFK